MNANGFLVSIAGLMLLAGCSLLGGEENDVTVERVEVHEIEVVSPTVQSVTFEVTGTWRNSCGEFSRFDSSRDGMTYEIEMYGQQPESATCFHVITPITGEWETSVPSAGTYTFQFWQQDGATLDTTLTFE